jgi:hypothetical protein
MDHASAILGPHLTESHARGLDTGSHQQSQANAIVLPGRALKRVH